MEIQVVGTMFVQTSTMDYEEIIALPLHNGNQVYSQAFGPHSCAWSLQFSSHFLNGLTYLAGHLSPIQSEFEQSLGPQWDRIISTFSLKVLHPITREVIGFKCLTGAHFFQNGNELAGWDEFIPMDSLTQLGLNEILVKVSIAWDPALLSEHTTLGKTKFALSQSVPLSEATQLRDKLKATESSLALKSIALQELNELRQRVKFLGAELSEVRNAEMEFNKSQVRVNTVRERLSLLRKNMEQDFSNISYEKLDPEKELEISRSEVVRLYHEKAQLDLKFSQAQSELQFVNRSSRDNFLLAPIAKYEEDTDPFEKIQQALETARSEITVGTATLAEVNEKLGDRPISAISILDRAGMIADMSMVQCGLDVANATLHEAAEHLHLLEDVSEFLNTQKELQEMRLNFIHTKIGLEEGTVRRASSAYLAVQTAVNTQTSSPLNAVSPPPIVPSVIPRHRGKRSSAAQFLELEPNTEIKSINAKLEHLSDMLKSTVIVPASDNARPFNPSEIPPWAPKEDKTFFDQGKLEVIALLTHSYF